ncbi:MAG TPA: prenyltransferase/squalene oxidase repeat-containing protein [Phycisphaerales bacterium]|nr:prenyltransferase/squalene oxidase repeat-containing protein [Phycisphaerales bacterium]
MLAVLVGTHLSLAQPPLLPPESPRPADKPAGAKPTDQAPDAPPEAKPAEGAPDTKPAPTKPADIKTAENAALAGEITPELDRSVARGLEFLVSEQADDGSFGSGRYGKNIAVTALSCIALMADGNVPGRGKYGRNVQKGLEFVLASSTETGLLAADSTNGPMYGHGFATLFLGEVYGMTRGGGETNLSTRTHEALVKACTLIERSQNAEGGWRYNPVPYDADVSVTICQIMALRSARNAGIEVPKETIDKAVEYVRQCQNPDGGFRYQTSQGVSAWPRSAAGVASLYYAGIYRDDAIDRGVKYVMSSAYPGTANTANGAHYFYGHYYSVQTMYLAGGESWAKWWPAVRRELIDKQQGDGSWSDPSVGPAYGTAMAMIILQMPKRFLPIFQK